AAPALARRAEAVQRARHWFPGRTTAHLTHVDTQTLRIKDHVIIVGYGLNGRNLARVLAETEIPFVVLDMDGAKVQSESKKGMPIYYGDATSPSVLRRMRVEDAKVFVLAISDPITSRRAVQVARTMNPSLHTIVRTRYLRELEELHALGADEVVPEEFETSIEIFALVLRTYKLPPEFIMRKAEQIRREKYALLRRGAMPELAHHLREGMLADVDVETCRIDVDSPAIGKSLSQLSLRPRTGASIIALTRAAMTESNPSEKVKLQAGDVVVLLGSRDQIQRALGLLMDFGVGEDSTPPR
ncbi:MAG TPA: NAD-binding protein, partial [Nitrospirales bacterium]|nr:NAD-binding protein [Nitrospirales bacterium]